MQPNSRALSEYEAVKQKKTALEAEIRKLKKEYLKAVEAGDNVSAISLKDKLDAATDEMLQAEAKMLELRNPKTP